MMALKLVEAPSDNFGASATVEASLDASIYLVWLLQENFDKRDNLEREKVSKRDNFPFYLT
jgi:hypothetical protein